MYNNKVSWYKLKNPDKFKKAFDGYMKSFNESENKVLAKSSLELKTFIFSDQSPKVQKWSLEPVAIRYIKPTDNKMHRYYPDLLIHFKTGETFLVEVKSYNETIPPKRPKTLTSKSEKNYKKALTTFAINTAKWKAAKKFCEEKNIKFIFLTERQLG